MKAVASVALAFLGLSLLSLPSEARRLNEITSTLPHPNGCPKRLFCACGAAVKIFGTPRRDLWMARAWKKFPRAAPGPGTVAVSNRHIFVIDRVLSGGMVMAYNYNGRGGRSTYQIMSLRGYSVHNPR